MELGKLCGELFFELNVFEVCMFIMSGYWGVCEMGKLYDSECVYIVYLVELECYLRK